MKISVIVPFYNEATYLPKCIKSLTNQSINSSEYQLIFINNNSTDQSVSIVADRLRDQDLLLHEQTPNVYVARNLGLKHARGKIIAFTDADCLVHNDWLKHISKAFADPNNGIILGRRQLPQHTPTLKYLQDYENQKVQYVLNQKSPSYYFAFTNNMAIRSRILDRHNLFKPLTVHADTELIHRLAKSSKKPRITYLPSATVTHLEITSPLHWYSKLALYGITTPLLHHQYHYHPLNLFDNLKISIDTAQTNHYSSWQMLPFFVTLFIGFLSFKLGTVLTHTTSLENRLFIAKLLHKNSNSFSHRSSLE